MFLNFYVPQVMCLSLIHICKPAAIAIILIFMFLFLMLMTGTTSVSYTHLYDVVILNYANCDMVGHTGVYPAAVKAVETVDECVGTLVDAVNKTVSYTHLDVYKRQVGDSVSDASKNTTKYIDTPYGKALQELSLIHIF